MVNGVTAVSDVKTKTVQLFDPQKKQVRKLSGDSEAVDKYVEDSHKATKKLFVDAGVGAAAVGLVGFGARLLYDGIKKHRLSVAKSLLSGAFAAISGFFAIGVVEYKKNVLSVVKNFIEHSEASHPLENKFGVEYKVPDIKEDNA